MKHYTEAEWAELVSIQNGMCHVDILTITAFFTTRDEAIRHLDHYRKAQGV